MSNREFRLVLLFYCSTVLLLSRDSRAAPDQLIAPRRIQGFDTNVTDAIFDCICHFQGHVQEIIHLTRSQLGDRYKFDFIPPGPEQESSRERD